MIVYGLTGGIGTGKSTVAGLLADRGAPVFDADAIGRELLSTPGPVALAVGRRFADCVGAEGIDRRRVAERVFEDEAERSWLEDLLHPAIQRVFEQRLAELDRPGWPFAILEGAVLLESRTRFELAGLLVVSAPEPVRIARLAGRAGLGEEAARARMRAQAPEHDKLLKATHWIDNGGNLEQTRDRVQIVWDQLVQEHGGLP